MFPLPVMSSMPWTRILLYLLVIAVLCIGLLAVKVRLQAARLDVAASTISVMGERIDLQNQAVERWKSAAEQQAAMASEAAKRAAQVRTVTVERIKTIAAAPIPNDCPDAIRWAAEQGVDFTLRWEGAK